MSRLYDEQIQEEIRKKEALLEVPDQLVDIVDKLDSISGSLIDTLEKFHPVEKRSIFLSHRSIDKVKISAIKTLLRIVGFDPWIDEERMPAGTSLDRAILDGIKNSCAAVFFITPNFEDSRFLSQEIDYAISEHRERPEKFSIIPILMMDEKGDCLVPELLKRFVAKRVASATDALIEIIRGLPIKPGPPVWKETKA